MPAQPQPDFTRLHPHVAAIAVRGSPDYDHARKRAIWNSRLTQARAPAAVVRCQSPDQVVTTIRFAREQGLGVSLRGSGHSYIAAPLQNDTVLIDLGAMTNISINRQAQRAMVGPGVRGSQLLPVLAHHGLAFPIGHCEDVALGGYLLAGGLGWNSGAWGPACLQVEAADIVLADGQLLHVTEQDHPDLLWAVRGAGCGFFAVVVAYHLRLKPMPGHVHIWRSTFCLSAASQVAPWLDEAIAAAPPGLELTCMIGPDFETGKPAISLRAIGIGDTPEQACAAVSDFTRPPAGASMLHAAEQHRSHFLDLPGLSVMPVNKRVAADQCWSDHRLGDLLLAVGHLADVPDAPSSINLVVQGGHGRIPRMPDPGIAALSVGGGVSAGIYAMWDEEKDDARHCEWVRRADAALTPFACGRYVGEADLYAAPERLRDCFSAAAWERLSELRSTYDPDGLICGLAR